MEIYSTKAIVLRVRESGAADLLVTLHTPDRGRIVCTARNARRSFRRFSGCLNLFSEIEAVIAAKESLDIARIESATLLEPFEGLRAHVRTLAAASAAAELVDGISRGLEEAPAVYDETRSFLAAASGRGDPDGAPPPRLSLAAFSLRILALSGFRPELDHCVSCGRDASAKNVRRLFDLHRGGLLCPKCAGPDSARTRGIVAISPAARSELKEMLATGVQRSAPSGARQLRAGVRPSVDAECARLVDSLVLERLGSPLRSWSAL